MTLSRILLVGLSLTSLDAWAAEGHGTSSGTARKSQGPPLTVETFADASQVQNVTAICFDDHGRLYVAESGRWRNGVEDNRDHLFWVMDDLASQTTADRRALLEKWKDKFAPDYFTRNEERVVRLEDTDGDGRADDRTVFADGFNDALDGPAIGLLSGFGKIYLTNIPHLWALTDADDDGIAEKRESLQEGFGPRFSLSGHDLHGLAWGPDGKLYFSMGDRGYHVQTREGKVLSDPGAGAAFRCDPDGSHLEVFYYGLRNPQELAFNEYGDLFTVDNNCDQGDSARVTYLMEGGDTGWHMGHQALTTFSDQVDDGHMEQDPHWMSEGLWKKRYPDQPAWILPALDYLTAGPSGLVFDSGNALSPRYQNHFLVCDYKGSSNQCFLYSFKVAPEGAGYVVRDPHIFHSGITAADVDVGYDGKIYLGDFGGGWIRPDRGNIFTLHDPEHIGNPVVAETQQLFVEGFAKRSVGDLRQLLAHADWRVRLRAQFTLAAMEDEKAIAGLLDTAHDEEAPLLARLHGLWGLRQRALSAPLRRLLEDREAEIRAQAARALGELRTNEAASALTSLLTDESTRVQAFAAIALSKVGSMEAFPHVITLLERNAGVDPFLRHAGIMALKGIAPTNALLELTTHPSPSVRLATVLTLRKRQDATIVAFLDDPDPRIAQEVIRAVNDLDLQDGLEAVAATSERLCRSFPANTLPDEMIFRRLLNANFRLGSPLGAKRLLLMGANASLPENYRVLALKALSVWPQPPSIDPTTGIYRPLPLREASPTLATIEDDLGNLLEQSKTPAIIAEAIGVARAFEFAVNPRLLRGWLLDRNLAFPARRAALHALETQLPKAFKRDLDQLQQDPDTQMRVAAAESMVHVFPKEAMRVAQQLLRGGSTAERRGAYTIIATSDDESLGSLLEEELNLLLDDEVPAAAALDLIGAAQSSPHQGAMGALANVQAKLSNDPLGALVYTYEGGDPIRGERVFANQGTCRKCHRVEGDDSEDAGPSLESLASRQSPQEILHSLAFPNEIVVPGYGIMSLILEDGTVITGSPIAETEATITVKTADSDPIIVTKADIASQTPALSPMPPMGLALPPTDIRDLMAYLQTLKMP